MSVIQNLEDSGKGKVFFNRAGASFPVAVFAAGILPDNIRLFPLSLTKEASFRSFLDPFILLYGKAVKMRRWQGGD